MTYLDDAWEASHEEEDLLGSGHLALEEEVAYPSGGKASLA